LLEGAACVGQPHVIHTVQVNQDFRRNGTDDELDLTTFDPAEIGELLERIPGARERIETGIAHAREGRVVESGATGEPDAEDVLPPEFPAPASHLRVTESP